MTFTDSLRFRLLMPLTVVGLFAVAFVVWMSTENVQRVVQERLDARATQLKRVLRSPTYPLSQPILALLAELTDCHLATASADDILVDSTLEALGSFPGDGDHITIARDTYLCQVVDLQRTHQPTQTVSRLAILVDTNQLTSEKHRAAILPIVTGTVVVGMCSCVWLWYASRLVGRLRGLQSRFTQISRGQFDNPHPSSLAPQRNDEIGVLSRSAESMAESLKELWNQVNRQQSERIIHQVAAGVAHQLRNSLTGARIAIELETRDRAKESSENLSVALAELEQSENQVKQLLMLASGKLLGTAPTPVIECVDQIRQTFRPIASHRKKRLAWSLDQLAGSVIVEEGVTWSAAVSNLIQNAIDAGTEVSIELSSHNDSVVARVCDDGPGVDAKLTDELFEPFVSTKPEGLGLGLAIAQRAAEKLSGELKYERIENKTLFCFTCPTAS
ncbi:MAG: HAMP domain-containing sensor histidine kinase [Planctomycetota bacterium]